MKKKIVLLVFAYILSTLLLVLMVVNLLNKGIEGVSIEQNKYKKHIGKIFVLQKDTLKIIDYSFINSTFTLSNGIEVDTSIIFNQK